MLDFTSSLYLGFWHASASLRPWTQLTSGVPSALAEPPGAEEVARKLARLQGCQAAVLGPSTLHLFWDLFGTLGREGASFYVDAGVYPIARWGVEHAASLGALIHRFSHREPVALERLLSKRKDGRLSVVVADGVCTCCGAPLPLRNLLSIVRQAGGLLVMDDTQALGVLGRSPTSQDPYGKDGGGSLSFAGVNGDEIILVSSLAKGFGAPLAVLSGSHELIGKFKKNSETRIHCSPPSLSAVHAAQRALEMNATQGDSLRQQLLSNVHTFRSSLKSYGLSPHGRLFPVQSLSLGTEMDIIQVHKRLMELGVKTILRQRAKGYPPDLTFVLTARHRPEQIESAVVALANILTPQAKQGLQGQRAGG